MIEQHHDNVQKVLQALCDACLYVNIKKCQLYQIEINFLGHHILADGIKVDHAKVERILKWLVPETAKQVCSFLGLVRYITIFLLKLAKFTEVLHELMTHDCNLVFPSWTEQHQHAFDAIKEIVISCKCLTTIDYTDSTKTIFIMTDASNLHRCDTILWGIMRTSSSHHI